jgi:propanol-preferring alcohol dehydrogenase
MKGVKLLGNRKLVIKDFQNPKAKDNWIVIAVKASALCGTDLNVFYRVDSKDAYNNNNFIPGHEIAGKIIEIDYAERMKVGDRVLVYPIIGCGNCFYCRNGFIKSCKNVKIIGFDLNGGHAEFLLVPERNLIPIPDDIPYEIACLAWDGIGVSLGVIKKLMVGNQDIVMVLGCGPIGLGAINNCKFFDATVIAVDLLDYRLSIAKKLGANYTINPNNKDIEEEIRKITAGYGPDVCLECTGIEKVLHQALSLVKRGGKCGLIGELGEIQKINFSDEVLHRDLTLAGGLIYEDYKINELINMIRQGLRVDKLITHTFNLNESKKAWKLFDEGKTAKVVIASEDE